MTKTKEFLIESILHFAEKFGLHDAYEYMVLNKTMPQVASQIVYQLFLNEVFPNNLYEPEFTYYNTIHEFCKELYRSGEVSYS